MTAFAASFRLSGGYQCLFKIRRILTLMSARTLSLTVQSIVMLFLRLL